MCITPKVDSVDLDAAFQWKKYFVIYRIDFSCDSQKRQRIITPGCVKQKWVQAHSVNEAEMELWYSFDQCT